MNWNEQANAFFFCRKVDILCVCRHVNASKYDKSTAVAINQFETFFKTTKRAKRNENAES